MTGDGGVWRRRLDAILAQPAYHPRAGGFSLEQLAAAWLRRLLGLLHIRLNPGAWPRWWAYAGAALVAAAALYLLLRLRRDPAAGRRKAEVRAGGPRKADDWLTLADERARAGFYADASRCLFQAILAHLAAAGALAAPSPARTNGEYVRELERAGSGLAARLRSIAAVCDELWYRRDAAPDGRAEDGAKARVDWMREQVAALLGGGGEAP